MMKTLYVLVTGIQDIFYSFNKEEVASFTHLKVLPSNEILSVEIDDDLAEKLLSNPNRTPPKAYPYTIEQKYYQEREEMLKNGKEKDSRIYIIFNANPAGYQGFWSPSGNNLNSFYKNNPEKYLGEAIRIPITPKQYVDIYGYFESLCDNF